MPRKQTRKKRIHGLPKDLGQTINKECGRWGHKWEYHPTYKVCTRIYCQRRVAYTPNPYGRRKFTGVV